MKVTVVGAGKMGSAFVKQLDNSAGALALFAASLSLLFSGAGRFSPDRAIAGEH
jgi:3-hydroxyacyl-CoA dehydrogenase